jgi:hypothetical protein
MDLSYSKRAVGVFSNESDAERALTDLRDAGFAMDRVSLIAQETNRLDASTEIGDTNVQNLAQTTHLDEGAKAGTATGGVVGGVTGLLVGLGTLAIPGVGPIMLAGAAATAIATTVAGGAIGAAAGGLLGGLVGLGIPEERARVYNDRVVAGGYLVVIDASEREILEAEPILKRSGIHEWNVYSSPAVTDRPLG